MLSAPLETIDRCPAGSRKMRDLSNTQCIDPATKPTNGEGSGETDSGAHHRFTVTIGLSAIAAAFAATAFSDAGGASSQIRASDRQETALITTGALII